MRYLKARGKRRLARDLVAHAWGLLDCSIEQASVKASLDALHAAVDLLEAASGFERKNKINGRECIASTPAGVSRAPSAGARLSTYP